MDKYLRPSYSVGINYLSILWLKSIEVNKRGPRELVSEVEHAKTQNYFIQEDKWNKVHKTLRQCFWIGPPSDETRRF